MVHKMDVASVNNTNDLTSQVILRVGPVYTKGTTVVSTFALFDEASTTTLIDETRVVGFVVPFCCRWMNKMSNKYETSRKVKFEISGIANGSKWFVIDVARKIEKLALPCQRIDVKFLMAKYPHLSRDVLEKIANAEQKILLIKMT
jgi:hypothetical protein